MSRELNTFLWQRPWKSSSSPGSIALRSEKACSHTLAKMLWHRAKPPTDASAGEYVYHRVSEGTTFVIFAIKESYKQSVMLCTAASRFCPRQQDPWKQGSKMREQPLLEESMLLKRHAACGMRSKRQSQKRWWKAELGLTELAVPERFSCH